MLPRAVRAVARPASTLHISSALKLTIPNHIRGYTNIAPYTIPIKPSQKRPASAIARREPEPDNQEPLRRFREFELDGRVFVVTGGAQGLGLTLAEVLVEAGGHVYCLDRQPKPQDVFYETQGRLASRFGGSLHYRQVDVQNADQINTACAEIAEKHSRMDGLVAAAAVQNVTPALEYPPDKITEMMEINIKGVFLAATACARQMIRYKTPGSIVLIGSMSGLIANRDFYAPIYGATKGAVIELTRNLAMEWGKTIDGKPIRVNSLNPGNILTPMVEANFKDDPSLKAKWESWNMLGRLSEPHEYRGAVLFMLSDASSFMTGSTIVIDGGYTAW